MLSIASVHRVSFSLFTAILMIVAFLAVVACGGSDETPEPEERSRPSTRERATDRPGATDAASPTSTMRTAMSQGQATSAPATPVPAATESRQSVTAATSPAPERTGTPVLAVASTPPPAPTREPTPRPTRNIGGIKLERVNTQALWDIYDALGGDNWKFQGYIRPDSVPGCSSYGNKPWTETANANSWGWYGVSYMRGSFGGGLICGLQLSSQGLQGSLPPQIGNLSLWGLVISNEDGLTGSLPPDLGKATGLRILTISRTNVEGEIPPEWFNLRKLERLDLSHNNLSGEITPEMAEFLSGLDYVDLRFNRLSGRISRESALAREQDRHEESKLTALIGNNVIIPDRVVLNAMFLRAGMSTLPEGTPLSEWPGVTTDADGTVTEIRMSFREYGKFASSGQIPSELTLLKGLKVLIASDVSVIPPELGAATNLEVLDLGNRPVRGIPPELGMLGNLKVLKLGGSHRPEDCIPDNLRGQLDMTKSNLGRVPFCSEQAAQQQREAEGIKAKLEA